MRKTKTSITIDLDLRHQCQLKGMNISQICNNALKTTLNLEGKEKEEFELIERKEKLSTIIEKTRDELVAIEISLDHFEGIRLDAQKKRQLEIDRLNNLEANTMRAHLGDIV